MVKRTLILSSLVGALALGAGYAQAADQDQGQVLAQGQQQDDIYGSQLMTPQERAEYRAKMRSLRTPEEREALRLEHHRQMQARARERGLTLPDMPPARAGGMGPGGAMGQGGGAMGGGETGSGGGMMGPGGGGMSPGGGGMMGPSGGMGPGGGMMGPGGGMGR